MNEVQTIKNTVNDKSAPTAQALSRKLCLSMLHSKGGCGKSEISVLIIDALKEAFGKNSLKAYDNDSKTPMLSGYAGASAEHIQLYKLDIGGNVKAESLSINKMNPIASELEHSGKNLVYVDNGSPSFEPFVSFFQADSVDMFSEIGVDFIIITTVTAVKVTHGAPLELLNHYGSSVKYIVIENEHFGEVTFDDTFYEKSGVQYSVFKMEKLTKAQDETLVRARNMNLLLSEAIHSKEFSLVEKSRLKTIKKSFDIPFLSILRDYTNA